MESKKEQYVLRRLIKLGLSENLDDPSVLDNYSDLKPYDHINRLNGSHWDVVTCNLSTEDLVALIKALAICERDFDWLGGSVSSVIWTFRELEKRDSNVSNSVADWILFRTKNPYVPFGNQNHGATSLSEYNGHRERIQSYQNEIAMLAKEHRIKRSIQRKKSANARNSDFRKEFIEQLSKKSLKDQLINLANDQEYSVEFYPTRMANYSKTNFLKNLDEKLVNALLEKLKGKHKGPWGRLKRNLLDFYRMKNKSHSTPWDIKHRKDFNVK